MATSGDIVKEYLSKFKGLPHHTLARKIYEEHKHHFTNHEHVRAVIRYYKGASGTNQRNAITNKEHFTEEAKNKYGIPPSDVEEIKRVIHQLPVGANKIGVLSDIHIPYHDIPALEASLDFFKKRGVNTLYLNGDTIDMYLLSKFDQNPTRRNPREEIDMTKEFLDGLKASFPECQIYFKIGNHEERWERYLQAHAPLLFNFAEFKLDFVLDLVNKGIHYVDGRDWVKAGNLHILHGHELGRSVFSPVNAARGFYLRAKHPLIAGHLHQTSVHTEPDLSDAITTVWATGCLCYLHPHYARVNRWNHGAAYVEIDNGDYRVHNFRIVNGKVY